MPSEVICPACGSNDVTRYEKESWDNSTFDKKFSYTMVYYKCGLCTEEIDILFETDKNYMDAKNKAEKEYMQEFTVEDVELENQIATIYVKYKKDPPEIIRDLVNEYLVILINVYQGQPINDAIRNSLKKDIVNFINSTIKNIEYIQKKLRWKDFSGKDNEKLYDSLKEKILKAESIHIANDISWSLFNKLGKPKTVITLY